MTDESVKSERVFFIMTQMSLQNIHASCVAIKGKGILMSGPPGIGKSTLALQLIDRGGLLVSDDQTLLTLNEDGQLIGSCPSSIQGRIEVRGVGLCTLPFQETCPLHLFVEISEGKSLERLPAREFRDYYGIQVPLLKLQKGDPIGALKVELKADMEKKKNAG